MPRIPSQFLTSICGECFLSSSQQYSTAQSKSPVILSLRCFLRCQSLIDDDIGFKGLLAHSQYLQILFSLVILILCPDGFLIFLFQFLAILDVSVYYFCLCYQLYHVFDDRIFVLNKYTKVEDPDQNQNGKRSKNKLED